MNCEKGDLAIVKPPRTGGYCDMTGELVEVLAPWSPDGFILPDGRRFFTPNCACIDEPMWFVRRMMPLNNCKNLTGELVATPYDYMWDHRLRPLRDNPGQDETLTWKDVPGTIKEAA